MLLNSPLVTQFWVALKNVFKYLGLKGYSLRNNRKVLGDLENSPLHSLVIWMSKKSYIIALSATAS